MYGSQWSVCGAYGDLSLLVFYMVNCSSVAEGIGSRIRVKLMGWWRRWRKKLPPQKRCHQSNGHAQSFSRVMLSSWRSRLRSFHPMRCRNKFKKLIIRLCAVFFLGIFGCNQNSFTFIKSNTAGKIKTHKHKHIMCSAPFSGLWTSAGCFEEGLIGHVFEWALSKQPWGEDGLGLFPFYIFHHASLPQNQPTHFEFLRLRGHFINPNGLWVSVDRVELGMHI